MPSHIDQDEHNCGQCHIAFDYPVVEQWVEIRNGTAGQVQTSLCSDFKPNALTTVSPKIPRLFVIPYDQPGDAWDLFYSWFPWIIHLGVRIVQGPSNSGDTPGDRP